MTECAADPPLVEPPMPMMSPWSPREFAVTSGYPKHTLLFNIG
jgi:hypothetical protein